MWCRTATRSALVALMIVLCGACISSPAESDSGDGAWAGEVFQFSAADEVFVAEGKPFRQVGLLLVGGPAVVRVELRDGDRWSEPFEPEITWQEGELRVGRLLLGADYGAARLVDGAAFAQAQLQLYPQVSARPDWPLARDLPSVGSASTDGVRTTRQQLLPDWIVTREAWGARDPSRVCGSAHTPRYITVHHTVTPTVDSISPAARVRGIQAYHIDSNGWCDVGYHFLVGQDGRVYQGRSSELRTGAHVGGANTDNVGVSFLGTFTTDIPADDMFAAGADVIRWLSDSYDVPLQRSAVRGHREWGSTECPGGALFDRLDRLLAEAAAGSNPDPDPGPDPDPDPEPADVYEADVDVRILGITDLLAEGDSTAVPDTVAGEQFSAEITVTNGSTQPLEGVELTYLIDVPFAIPGPYRIETDAPAYDRASWTIDAADADVANPSVLSGSGWLYLGSLAPNETKRVVVALMGGVASLDHSVPTKVRAWLRRAVDVYELHDRWDTIPTVDRIGRHVRDESRFDSLPTSSWDFEGDYGLEGWSSCGGPADVVDGALELGPIGCVDSPSWTWIDAGRFDQIVLVVEALTDTEFTLTWDEEQAVDNAVSIPVAGGVSTVVVPVGLRTGWQGDIGWLRLSTAGGPDADRLGEIRILSLWAQDSESRVSTGPGFSTHPPLDLEEAPANVEPELPGVEDDRSGGLSSRSTLESSAGCAVTSGTVGLPGLLGLAAVFVFRRRRVRNLTTV